jgi:hypothetical protein
MKISEKLDECFQDPPSHGLLSVFVYYHDGKPTRIVTGREDSKLLEPENANPLATHRLSADKKIVR